MPPLNTKLVIYNQVWALLEGSSAFTSLVLEGNRLKSTDLRMPERELAKTAPGDFPRVRIDVAEENLNDRAPRTMAMNATNYSAAVCDYGVPITLNLTVKIVYDKTTLQDQTPVEAAIHGALFAKGPNLGIAWVGNSVWRDVRRTEEKNADTGGTLRTVDRAKIIIQARPKLSQLTAT